LEPLYTSSTHGNKKFQGWSEDGIKKYNELLDKVENDRDSAKGKEREKAFLQYKTSSSSMKKRRNKDSEEPRMKVRARHSLFKKNPAVTGIEGMASYGGGFEEENIFDECFDDEEDDDMMTPCAYEA
jgi:hypothetical protein